MSNVRRRKQRQHSPEKRVPGGFKLGNSLELLQGALLGAGALWGLVIFVLWLCGLQLVAFLLGTTRRLILLQWIIRLGLLVKSAPIALFTGLVIYTFTQPGEPSLSERGDPSFVGWNYFLATVVWFAFVPSAIVFASSLIWIVRQAIVKARASWRPQEAQDGLT